MPAVRRPVPGGGIKRGHRLSDGPMITKNALRTDVNQVTLNLNSRLRTRLQSRPLFQLTDVVAALGKDVLDKAIDAHRKRVRSMSKAKAKRLNKAKPGAKRPVWKNTAS